MNKPTSTQPIQKAWIVTDIEAAARRWSETLGIGPFHVAEYPPETFDSMLYRGKPGKLHMKTAIAYAGMEQIELVEPVGVYDCAYYDTIAPGSEGFHHLCFWTDDLDADIAWYESAGNVVANKGQMAGGGPGFAYIDASATIGCMIELLERLKPLEELFESWRQTCLNWPGKPTIIRL